MRLSSLFDSDWHKWAPYVDTLLIPVYEVRIPGKEPDLGEAQRVREVADGVERELSGRLLLLPGIPYGSADDSLLRQYVEHTVCGFKKSGFHHLFLLSPRSHEGLLTENAGDAWKLLTVSGKESESRLEDEVEAICQQVVATWETQNFGE